MSAFPSMLHESPQLLTLSEELLMMVVEYLDYPDLIVLAAANRQLTRIIYSTPALWLWPALDDAKRFEDLNLRWMDQCAHFCPVLARRLHPSRIRAQIKTIWMPAFVLTERLDVVGFFQMFPNLETINAKTLLLIDCFTDAVRRTRAIASPPAAIAAAIGPPPPVLAAPGSPPPLVSPTTPAAPPPVPAPAMPPFLLPTLKRIYLDDEPTTDQYLLLQSVTAFLTPHPHPLTVALCMQCMTNLHAYTTTHDEYGCPVAACAVCDPTSECLRCHRVFCASHLVSIASICPHAAAQGVADAVCTWCHAASIVACDACGALDCPHCRESGDLEGDDAHVPTGPVVPVNPLPPPPPGGFAALGIPGTQPAAAGATAPPLAPRCARTPVVRCDKCRRARCGQCATHYTCPRCDVTHCASCVEGAVCVLCNSTAQTCSECYLDVHLARDDLYHDMPRVCLSCDYVFCEACRDAHRCDAFLMHARLHARTARLRTHVRRVREERAAAMAMAAATGTGGVVVEGQGGEDALE
ncbi:hypothetical protein GGF32_008863 [Allomyces javanicus]|nr:hypothetical protein GGF32_008863 [Allomyces javanicus]